MMAQHEAHIILLVSFKLIRYGVLTLLRRFHCTVLPGVASYIVHAIV